MRDPKRIRPLLDRLATAWEQCPDMRLGQLLTCVIGKDDVFYMEDQSFMHKVEQFVARTPYVHPKKPK